MIHPSEDHIKQHLSRGIRVPRFRKTTVNPIRNRVLMAVLFAEDLKISELAKIIGVSSRTVSAWIYDGRLPSDPNSRKVEELLGLPKEILFDPTHYSVQPLFPGESKFHANILKGQIVNRVLAGLFRVHDLSPKDVAAWIDLHPATIRKYIHNGTFRDNIEVQDKLSRLFRLPGHILFFEGTNNNQRKGDW